MFAKVELNVPEIVEEAKTASAEVVAWEMLRMLLPVTKLSWPLIVVEPVFETVKRVVVAVPEDEEPMAKR